MSYPQVVGVWRARVCALGVVAIFWSLACSADAQLNVETLASGVSGPGWSFGATSALSFAYGNVDLFEVRGNASVAHATAHPDAPADAWRFWFRDRTLLYGSAGLRTVSNEDVANDGFVHLRYTRMHWLRVGTEVFSQLQYDEFRLLRRRMLAGAGGRFVFANFEKFSGWVGTAYMVEDERRRVPEDENPHMINHRWSNYVTTVLFPRSEQLSVVNTVYVQPRFDNPADIQVLDDLNILLALAEHVSFTLGLTVRYDSRAPSSVEKLDIRLSNGVTLQY